MPFAIVLGEDELAQGKVKIKEMGLNEGHPEKEGVLVNMSDLVAEMQQRLKRKANMDKITQQGDGLRVVDGIRGELEKTEAVSETEKPASETPMSQQAIEAIPAS